MHDACHVSIRIAQMDILVQSKHHDKRGSISQASKSTYRTPIASTSSKDALDLLAELGLSLPPSDGGGGDIVVTTGIGFISEEDGTTRRIAARVMEHGRSAEWQNRCNRLEWLLAASLSGRASRRHSYFLSLHKL